MTPKEVATKVISLWRMEHAPDAIMMTLVMLGTPATKRQVLNVVKAYCDACTENVTYGTKKSRGGS